MNALLVSSPVSRSALLIGCLLWAAHAAGGQVQRITGRPSSPASSADVGSTSQSGRPPTPGDPMEASESDDSGADQPPQDPGIHPRSSGPKKAHTESWAVEGYATCGGAQVVDDPKGAQRSAEADTTWHFLGSAQRDVDADHEDFRAFSGSAHGEATTKQSIGLSAAGLSAGGDEFAQGRFTARLRLDLAIGVQDLQPDKMKKKGMPDTLRIGKARLSLTEGQFDNKGTQVHHDSGTGTLRSQNTISVPNLVIGPPVSEALRVEGTKSPYTAVLTDPGGCITVAGRKPLSVRLILQLNPAHQERNSR